MRNWPFDLGGDSKKLFHFASPNVTILCFMVTPKSQIGPLSSVGRSELDDKWLLVFPSDSFHMHRNLHRQYIRVCKS